MVLIEPLATMRAVEDFLAPRVRPVAPTAAAAPGDGSNPEVHHCTVHQAARHLLRPDLNLEQVVGC